MIIVTNETKVWAVPYGVTYYIKWLLLSDTAAGH